MIPGVNPRQMQQMMKRMGIQQVEIDATEVIIRCPDKDLIITDPQVSKVNMMGQETFQIVGKVHEQENQKVDISEEDIKTVVEQTGSSEDDAKGAIEECNGDLAEAIMKLKKD